MYWPVLYSRNELASTFLSQLDTVFHELNHFEQVLKMKSDKYVSYNNYIIIIDFLLLLVTGSIYKSRKRVVPIKTIKSTLVK